MCHDLSCYLRSSNIEKTASGKCTILLLFPCSVAEPTSGPHLLFDCKGCYGEGCHKLNPSKHLLSSYLQNLFFSAQAGQALFASDISMLAVPSLEVLDLTVSGNKLPYFQVKLLLDLHTSDLLACSPWGPLTNTVIIERWQKVASQ